MDGAFNASSVLAKIGAAKVRELMFMRVYQFITPKALLFLILLFFGCSLPFGCNVEPANIEIVVPKSEKVNDWALSPDGEKIIYRSEAQKNVKTFLLFLKTTQKRELDMCDGFTWFNDTILLCNQSIVIVDELLRIPLQEISTADVSWKEVLEKGGKAYRIDEYPWFCVLDANYRAQSVQNYLVKGEDAGEVLKPYSYVTVPRWENRTVNSPDGAYYATTDGVQSVVIYDNAHKNKVSEFKLEESLVTITLGGWAADSSGVYFQVMRGGILTAPQFDAIKKLRLMCQKCAT